MEEGVHFREVGALHIEIGLVFHESLTEGAVDEVLYQLVEAHLSDLCGHALVERTGALGP